jgi:hypothetical protein
MSKAAKKATPAKGKSKPETEVQSGDDTGMNLVPTIKTGALSKDVGPMVIAGLAKAYEDEKKANELIDAVKAKRYDLLAATTAAIVKAAKADDSIDLSAAFKDNKKAINLMNAQIGLALGFREVETVGDGDKAKSRLVYAKSVSKYFPTAKDPKDAPATIQKATTRSNFMHLVKKCAMAAHAIVLKDLDIKKDAKTGTLQITGPAVNKTFGAESVLLDEKITVGEGENKTKLKKKPSFTALAEMAAESEGKVVAKRGQTGTSGTAIDPSVAIQSVCTSLLSILPKLKALDPKTTESLKAARTAIDNALKT